MSDNLSSNCKLFVDDTLLFSVVKYHTQSGIDLNIDLRKIVNKYFSGKVTLAS